MFFNQGDSFNIDNDKYEVKSVLGVGGQGEVYLVNDGTKDYAFKVYIQVPKEEFKYNLRNNIKKGAPNQNYLWPTKYVEFEGGKCGYLMDVRPSNYKSFRSYANGKTRFKDLRTMINWAIELVKSFKILHQNGYSYQDINDGSFFIDPDNGNILICDNDNVTADKKNLGIRGMMKYMAPEIVRCDIDPLTNSAQLPDIHSDRFSLAVILFRLFLMADPFEGECLKKYVIVTEQVQYEMYGTNPVYIYNKDDESNRPIRGYHTAVINRYPLIPSYIKDAFHKTFVDGLKDRENGRVTEIEWLKLLSRFRDELITCPNCGRQYYYGFYEDKPNKKCLDCGNPTKEFGCLQINKQLVALELGKYIYESHLDKYSGSYNNIVGKVVASKNNPSIWGIKLNLNNDVLIKASNGKESVVKNDGVIPIIKDLKIKFNEETLGQIRLKEDVENVR